MNIREVSNRTIKSLSRQMLKGHFFKSLVFLICCSIMAKSVSFIVVNIGTDSDFLGVLSDIYYLVIQGPISFATAIYFLWMFRGQPVGFNSLTHGFEYFRKVVNLYLQIFIRCLGLAFFFLVPGIICLFRYSQSFYILADNPTKGVFQCMAESKAMMKGLEGRYFKFCLGYIGIFVLSIIPQMAVTAYLMDVPYVLDDYTAYMEMASKVISSPLMTLSQVFIIAAQVYFTIGTACFFDIVSGKLIIKTDECEECTE